MPSYWYDFDKNLQREVADMTKGAYGAAVEFIQSRNSLTNSPFPAMPYSLQKINSNCWNFTIGKKGKIKLNNLNLDGKRAVEALLKAGAKISARGGSSGNKPVYIVEIESRLGNKTRTLHSIIAGLPSTLAGLHFQHKDKDRNNYHLDNFQIKARGVDRIRVEVISRKNEGY